MRRRHTCGAGRGAQAVALALAWLAGMRAGGPRAAEAKWTLDLGLEERYDDNIIQLSSRDIDRLQNPRPSDALANRFSIETPDDIISIPRLSTGLKANWLAGRPTLFDLDASAYAYRDNPIKDYQSYRLYASQSLHRHKAHATSLAVSYALIPRFYLRNLISDRAIFESGAFPPPGLPLPREEATYRKKITEVQVEQQLAPDRLHAEGALGQEARDYNRDFDERDSQMPYREAQLAWDPLGDPRLRLRVAYRRENLHAAGNLTETDPFFTEDDISSRRNIWVGDVRARWGKKGLKKTARMRYEAEDRDYTTGNVNDRFHFGRTDARRYSTLTFQAELKKSWYFTAQVERDRNRSQFPSSALGASDPNDTTDYTENLYQLGFGYQFGFGGSERQPGGPESSSE